MPTIPPVPIPSGPTNPAGGSGSTSTYYALTDNLPTGAPLAASDLDKLINLLDNNTAAALAGVGAGTLVGGDWGAVAGLTVVLNAWRGILPNSSVRVGYAGAILTTQTITVPATSNFVLWAIPVTGTYGDGNPYDTAESGQAAVLVVTDGSTPDGGTPLFSGVSTSGITSTSLTDQRIPVGLAALSARVTTDEAKEIADVAALQLAIGSIYFNPTTAPATSIADRVKALETSVANWTGGGTGGGGTGAGTTPIVYWNALQRLPSDPTTIPQYVQAQLPTPVVPATPATITDDVVVTNMLKLALGTINVDGHAQTDKMVDVLLIVPGLTPDALIDLVNTTAPIDNTAHTIG